MSRKKAAGATSPRTMDWGGKFREKSGSMLIVPLAAKECTVRITAFWKKGLGDHKQVSDKCREVAKEFVDYSLSQGSLKDFILGSRNSS